MKPLVGNNNRLYLAVLLTATVVFSFWMTSRYPDLNEKAMMGGDIGIAALGFDTVIELRSDAGFVKRVFATTVNWIDTNKKGMAFGLVLAACIMTLLSLFSRRSFSSVFANTAMGTMIGAPLGVCVNCVAPIARGMHAAGATLETTLATMLSSPTMNIIVLTMTFTLLPFYMAASKVALTLVFILIGIPILSKFASRANLAVACPVDTPGSKFGSWTPPAPAEMLGDDGLFGAARWLVVTFGRNLWFIVRKTVPLMLAAGFLGALAVTALPWHVLVRALPDVMSVTGAFSLLAVAIFGVLLPVPIAFDIIIVTILLGAGLLPSYAMALLFTLGIFSIYSLSIVWTSISRAIAVILAIAFAVIGVGAGYFANAYDKWDQDRQREAIFQAMARLPDFEVVPPVAPLGQPHAAVADRLRGHALSYRPVAAGVPPGIAVEMTPFRPAGAATGDTPFTRFDGADFGLANPANFTVLRAITPYYWGAGIATGDVHNDGWADVLIALDSTAKGLALFANVNGERFVRQDIAIPAVGDLNVINAALVDLNNDGWLDIALTSYQQGNFVVYNRNGDFLAANFQALPSRGDGTAVATTFGDIDRDGDLDGVLGYWSVGFGTNHPGSQNLILRQRQGGYDVEMADEILGETLTTLFSDYSGDGALDLIVGNDFKPSPDIYYLGDGTGGLRQLTAQDGVIPHSTDTTMSIATGDLDNDLVPEIFLAQIARGTGTGFKNLTVPAAEVCTDLTDGDAVATCRAQAEISIDATSSSRRRNVERCLELGDQADRQECAALTILRSVRMKRSDNLCDLLPSRLPSLKTRCIATSTSPAGLRGKDMPTAIPYVERRNVMLVRQQDGTFADHAEASGITIGGWSWNAKFADLDNDGLKDLYVANGLQSSRDFESNLFYRNTGSLNFANETLDFGLVDHRPTAAYSYVDFDNDGDLDIVSLPVSGGVRVFVNSAQRDGRAGNAIAISLRDHAGNRFGIGSKIIVRGGENGGDAQLVEIQSGGGFISFDPPVAHFGLGAADSVDSIEVQWSTGERSVLQGPFAAGAHYVVTRNGS